MTDADNFPEDHPIFNPQAFFIDTPMIGKLRAMVTQWLWCGATGGYLIGHARVGKSRAIRHAMASLTTRSGQPIPAFYMDFHQRDRPTVTNVFRNLQRALDIKIKVRETADLMCDGILHCLADASFANNQRYVILVVDEVQRATVQQLLAFTELYDILIRLQINLFVVFVANIGESDTLLSTIRDGAHEQIRGRFFLNGYHYHGLRSRDEVAACLQQYDETHFPTHGPTITEAFLKDSYKSGWRLHTLADAIWRIYRDSFQQPLRLESWGMQYFTAAVKTLLVDYLPAFGVENSAEVEDMIYKSIEVSGLARSQVHPVNRPATLCT